MFSGKAALSHQWSIPTAYLYLVKTMSPPFQQFVFHDAFFASGALFTPSPLLPDGVS